MLKRHLRVAVLACGLVAVYAEAADKETKAQDREGTSATRKSAGPSSNTVQPVQPPLQTGEVRVPEGGVDTSQFDPNAGEGVKGRSTPGGGTIQPRGAVGGGNVGATGGAPLSGATAPGNAGDDGQRRNSARGDRGSGKTQAGGGNTRESETAAGARSR